KGAPGEAAGPAVPVIQDTRFPPETTPKEPPPTSPAETTPPAKPEETPAQRREAVLKKVKSAIAYLEGKRGSGSAFMVAKGILASNNHVLQDEYIDELQARFVSAD